MTFTPGQYIRGHYGNFWTRREDGWYDEATGNYAFRDETAEWLINLRVETPKLAEKIGPKKLSKSAPAQINAYVYRYTLRGPDVAVCTSSEK